MKKKTVLLLCAAVLVLLAACFWLDSARYVCRQTLPGEEKYFSETDESAADTPFISDERRDRLFARLIRRALPSFREPVAVEIRDCHPAMYEGKQIMWYMLRFTDSDGFVTIFDVILYPRW